MNERNWPAAREPLGLYDEHSSGARTSTKVFVRIARAARHSSEEVSAGDRELPKIVACAKMRRFNTTCSGGYTCIGEPASFISLVLGMAVLWNSAPTARCAAKAHACPRRLRTGSDLASGLGRERSGSLREAWPRCNADPGSEPLASPGYRWTAVRVRRLHSARPAESGCGWSGRGRHSRRSGRDQGQPNDAVDGPKDCPIQGPQDLKGKVIAAPTLGAVMHSATLYWLKKNGVDPTTVRGVEVPFPNMADQLKAGSIDAAEALVPFTGAMLAAGDRTLGDPMLAVGDEVLFPFWISEGNWARANKATIKAWIAALTEAHRFMQSNNAETRAILAKYSRLPPAIVEKVPLPTYRFTIKKEELAVWVDVLNELGQLPAGVDKEKLVVTAE